MERGWGLSAAPPRTTGLLGTFTVSLQPAPLSKSCRLLSVQAQSLEAEPREGFLLPSRWRGHCCRQRRMKERIWQEESFPSSWLWSEQVAPNLSMWWGVEAGGERMNLKI